MVFAAKTICFIALHGGPADHFATFAKNLTYDGYNVRIYASGPAFNKFQMHKIKTEEFILDSNLSENRKEALAQEIAQKCSKAFIVITDVGHHFARSVTERTHVLVD